MDAETLYTRLFLCSQLVCYDGSVGLLHAGRTQHAWFAWQQQLYILFCPTWRTHLFNFLYFKRQRCRTSLLIFSFFILSPSLLCVCISFPNSHCLFYVFWIYFCLHLHLTDGFDSVPFHRVCNKFFVSFLLYIHVGTTPMVTSPHPVHVAPFCLSSLALAAASPSLRPCPSLQHWDQGGGNSEEPERFIACTWLQAGPQSALLSAPSGPEPKPAHRLGVPQHSLPAGQTPLQLSLRPPFPCFFLSFPRSGYLSTSFLCFSVSFSSEWGAVCRQCRILSGWFSFSL